MDGKVTVTVRNRDVLESERPFRWPGSPSVPDLVVEAPNERLVRFDVHSPAILGGRLGGIDPRSEQLVPAVSGLRTLEAPRPPGPSMLKARSAPVRRSGELTILTFADRPTMGRIRGARDQSHEAFATGPGLESSRRATTQVHPVD